MAFEVINPATGKKLKSYKALRPEQVVKRIKKADKVQQEWEKTSFAHRAALMKKAADILEKDKKKYAEIMTLEMGKTLKSAISEVEKCAWVCRYYAEKTAEFLAPEVVATDASKSYVHFAPIGIVLAVMPWNFPLWQVFRFAAPALMAGNAGLLKHASNVPGSAKLIQAIFQKAGFPKGLFTNLLIPSKMVADVIEHPLVKAVTLTGSEAAGKAVAETAGKAIKKSVLELGGSDAYLILEDADLEKAVKACVTSRLLNNGQSCIGAKRFVVVQSVYRPFLQLFKAKMAAAKMGNPRKKTTDLGPMARVDLRNELHEQVTKSVEMGAKCILGGKIPDRKGAFY
ncbi:MAG: aldehyde dehydrogenase family protein, partial [Bacteroidota bacterium]